MNNIIMLFKCLIIEFTLPKMRAKGKLVKHFIRRPERPSISEIDSALPETTNSKAKSKKILPKPDYEIRKEPKGDNATHIIVDIKLPDIVSFIIIILLLLLLSFSKISRYLKI